MPQRCNINNPCVYPCVNDLDVQEQQARATQYDQGMPATNSQSRQESWPSSAGASSQQSNVSGQSREDGQQLSLQQQRQQQQQQQPQQQQQQLVLRQQQQQGCMIKSLQAQNA